MNTKANDKILAGRDGGGDVEREVDLGVGFEGERIVAKSETQRGTAGQRGTGEDAGGREELTA
ncbi:MAG: hypothetical protein J07HN4v3_02768 [Halonotius sp. J07HN4]|nr:MAG: hypothetical protein J07HN4v3_02768 [Halonotius sp. J07HN4]